MSTCAINPSASATCRSVPAKASEAGTLTGFTSPARMVCPRSMSAAASNTVWVATVDSRHCRTASTASPASTDANSRRPRSMSRPPLQTGAGPRRAHMKTVHHASMMDWQAGWAQAVGGNVVERFRVIHTVRVVRSLARRLGRTVGAVEAAALELDGHGRIDLAHLLLSAFGADRDRVVLERLVRGEIVRAVLATVMIGRQRLSSTGHPRARHTADPYIS